MKRLIFLTAVIVGLLGAVSGCPDQLDIAFVLDGSGSVGSSNWMIVQDFLVDVIMRFSVGGNNVRVGVVTYGSSATTRWNLDHAQTFSASSLAQALGRLRYSGGATATAAGLSHARSNVITASGSRSTVPNVVVVVTDGRNNRPRGSADTALRTEANNLKNIARVVVIGVGSIDRTELNLIASSPCDVYTVNDFSQMNNNMPARMDQICGCMPGYMRSSTCACVACQMRMVQPDWGQTECQDCPSDLIGVSDMAAMQCGIACPAGSKVDSTGQRCELCQQNTYQPLDYQDVCLPCPRGKATRGPGATSPNQCETVCEPGQRPVGGDCEPCPVNTYQPSAFSTMCIPCPAGFSTRGVGSTSMAQCIAVCNSGRFAGPDNMCMACPIGTYQDMTLAEVCTACPNGTSTRMNGSMSVGDCKEVCPPGQHADADEMECLPCDPGYYQPDEFAPFCLRCPSGTDTPRAGMTACPQTSSSSDGMDGGAMAGLIVGLVLFLVLLALIVLLCLCFWRKRAYARDRARAEGTTIDNANYGVFVSVKKKLSGMLGGDSKKGDNDYSQEPRKSPLGKDGDYDEVYKAEDEDHMYDNQGVDTYDSPKPRTGKPGSHVYANA